MSDVVTGPPVSSAAVPPVTGSLLVTCEYDASGLEYVILHDNIVLAWLIDTTGVGPPWPVVVGSFPPAATGTAPIISPPWVVREGGPSGTFFAPDLARGTALELFNALATNNGAQRKLYANFAETSLINSWNEWKAANPSLALTERPH
jgi:hypothetical protein